MSNHPAPPASGWPFIPFGIFLAAVGLLLLSTPADTPANWLGQAAIGIGSILATIGAIAVGVTIGLLRAEHLRNQ